MKCEKWRMHMEGFHKGPSLTNTASEVTNNKFDSSLEWSKSNFSSKHQYIIKYMGDENRANYQLVRKYLLRPRLLV